QPSARSHVRGLSSNHRGAGNVTTGVSQPSKRSAAEELIEALREGDDEAADARAHRALVRRLDDDMQMVRLNRVVDDVKIVAVGARALALENAHEHPLHALFPKRR